MLMVMASELPSKSILIALKQKLIYISRGLTASVKHFTRICGHTLPEPTTRKLGMLTSLH